MATKKILILSSFGGYGHIAATNTLKTLLGSDCDIDVVYPIKELRILGIPSGESFYNFLISNNLNRLTNWIVRWITPPLFMQREEKVSKLVGQYIEDSHPDLVISVVPFINYAATEAARKYDLPMLMITTDNDLVNWVYGLQKRDHTNFKVTIGSDLPTSKGRLLERLVPQEMVETVGLPLRPEFLQTKSKELLRQAYEIPENKDVILVMMGGVGARTTYKYVKTILESSLNVHVMVCAGKNRKLAKKLRGLLPAMGNSIDIVPFTEKVHEIFALSDLVITKPGPGSINEALSLKIPVLIDRLGPALFWEDANIDLILSHNLGACVHSLKDVPDLIRRFLYDEQTREAVARAYEALPKNQFADRIRPLIKEMCGELTPASKAMTSTP